MTALATRFWGFAAVSFVLGSLGSFLGGCGEDVPADPCGEPVYGGEATDEAWRTMVDGEDRAAVGDPSAPVLTTPTEGQSFEASDAPPQFVWTSLIALGPNTGGDMELAATGSDDQRQSWLADLWELIVPKAYAHLPPITGDVYYLQMHIPNRECDYRVLTTNLDFQVDADGWAALQEGSGQPITLDIMSAYLTENRITEGPYKPAATTTFTVSP